MRSILLIGLLAFTIGMSNASEVMSPRIVELDGFHVVGMQTFGNPSDGSFPNMWSALFNFEGSIPNITNDTVSYGIETYTKEHHTQGKWFYMAGRQVEDLSNVPVQMSAKHIPPNKYAVFEYKGSITARLGEQFQYIYKDWLPESGYELAGPFDFEKYDARFLGSDNENSVFEIYIPIKAKEK
ncbi:GyrI-like domain-containing protein [Nitrogeniibacter aestuarii]|uniref:GyrI-like domain-containing protein n=1 Tax=Nitrogeniibacter aestuarii TaxID=2815343 RepID=UPI001E4AD8CD|nr:GyrI-like domain-containing protein [Nitrogeniibacter aestuarii]